VTEHKKSCTFKGAKEEKHSSGELGQAADGKAVPGIFFSSIEEVEEKLQALKLIDFSKGFVQRKNVSVQYYEGDNTKVTMENMKRDLLMKWGHPVRDMLQLFVTHVELQFGYNTGMSSNGVKGIYLYFYCPPKSRCARGVVCTHVFFFTLFFFNSFSHYHRCACYHHCSCTHYTYYY
jgi:hypothetical protein